MSSVDEAKVVRLILRDWSSKPIKSLIVCPDLLSPTVSAEYAIAFLNGVIYVYLASAEEAAADDLITARLTIG